MADKKQLADYKLYQVLIDATEDYIKANLHSLQKLDALDRFEKFRSDAQRLQSELGVRACEVCAGRGTVFTGVAGAKPPGLEVVDSDLSDAEAEKKRTRKRANDIFYIGQLGDGPVSKRRRDD